MLFLPGVLSGQSRLRERVYVSTDREVYVAGDAVWMSAYCMDASSGKLSSFSKTAYVEIHSAAGMVQTAKIALEGGRGGGRLMLPNTLPTGNYRLLAYTALGASEEGFDPSVGARTLSVFNTFSNERIDGGVKVVGQAPAAAALPQAGGLAVSSAASAEMASGSRSASFGAVFSRNPAAVASPSLATGDAYAMLMPPERSSFSP